MELKDSTDTMVAVSLIVTRPVGGKGSDTVKIKPSTKERNKTVGGSVKKIYIYLQKGKTLVNKDRSHQTAALYVTRPKLQVGSGVELHTQARRRGRMRAAPE